MIYLKENWQRIYSVDVIPYETLGHGIDYEKNKEFIKDITVTVNVKTLDEALEIAENYNLENDIK